jgi:hypothetical protein
MFRPLHVDLSNADTFPIVIRDPEDKNFDLEAFLNQLDAEQK